MEDLEHGNDDITDGTKAKPPSKIRDVFTGRVVGIVTGAVIPVVLLFIPIINKYQENTKEIQALQIQSNAKDIEATNQRLSVLTEALVTSQIQIQDLTSKLGVATNGCKKTIEELADCKHSLANCHG